MFGDDTNHMLAVINPQQYPKRRFVRNPRVAPPTEEECALLQKIRLELSAAIEKFVDTQRAIALGAVHQDTTITLEDAGIAVTGAVLGAIITRNAAGIPVGIGVSLGATVIWREAVNVVGEHLAWSAMQNDLADAVRAARAKVIGTGNVDLEVRISELAENRFDCNGRGGSW
jgi:hypothetical protein